MTWADKIRCIEKELEISGERGRLARLLGVRPGRISEIKNGKSKNPGSDITLLLIDRLGINPEWLNKEEPPVFIDNKRLKKQPIMQNLAQKETGESASPPSPDTPADGKIESPQREGVPGTPLILDGDRELEDGIVIPLLENAASAGYGAGLEDDDVPARYIRVPRFLAKYPHLASLPVKGDSMEPTLHDGDLVVCDGGGWDGDGIYVVKTVENIFVKRVLFTSRGYQVVSDNKMYPGYTESAEELAIVGKVRAILAMVPGRRGGV